MNTAQQVKPALTIGGKVRFYCPTDMRMREGTVTAVDVPVTWLWEWPEHGTVMQSPHRHHGAVNPLGVEIDGGLARPYGRDKSEVQA